MLKQLIKLMEFTVRGCRFLRRIFAVLLLLYLYTTVCGCLSIFLKNLHSHKILSYALGVYIIMYMHQDRPFFKDQDRTGISVTPRIIILENPAIFAEL